VLSIWKYITVVNSGANDMTENEISVWMLLTLSSFLLLLFQFGLALSGIQFFWKNITYIELLKGTFQFNDKHGLHPNPFDLGPITNYATIFEGESWTFWIPTEMVPRYDGTQYPMPPPITDQDKKALFPHIQ
jgi:hypothetical protein